MLSDFEKRVICDIYKDDVENFAMKRNLIPGDDDLEEYTEEKIVGYLDENEIKADEEDIADIRNCIMNSIDFDAIEEQKEDSEYIKTHGIYRYLGIDRDF